MSSRILDDVEFENQINALGDNQIDLIKFVARQQFASSKLIAIHDTDIAALKNGDRKVSGIIGGISGIITSVVIGIINYFIGANKG